MKKPTPAAMNALRYFIGGLFFLLGVVIILSLIFMNPSQGGKATSETSSSTKK